MKLFIAVLLLAVVFTTNAMASAQGAIIKKKAKDFSNQNSINQGVAPAQPARPATTPAQTPQTAAPAAPKINEAQQQNINLLVADLKTIKLKSSATTEQKQK